MSKKTRPGRIQLGKRIRTLRKQRGLSQEQLGHRANVTPSYCGAVERAEKAATIDTVDRICEGLGVSLGELIAGDEIEHAREVEALLHDIPYRLRDPILRVVREAILMFRGVALELTGPRTALPR